jgi:hypothetical protein
MDSDIYGHWADYKGASCHVTPNRSDKTAHIECWGNDEGKIYRINKNVSVREIKRWIESGTYRRWGDRGGVMSRTVIANG